MPKQGVDKKTATVRQKRSFYSTAMICGTCMLFYCRNLALSLFSEISFLLVEQLAENFRTVALHGFLTTMTYDDWVNENLREIKYFEE